MVCNVNKNKSGIIRIKTNFKNIHQCHGTHVCTIYLAKVNILEYIFSAEQNMTKSKPQ